MNESKQKLKIRLVLLATLVMTGPVFGACCLAQDADQLNERLQGVREQMALVAEQLGESINAETVRQQDLIVKELNQLIRQFSAGEQGGGPQLQTQSSEGSTQSGTAQGTGMATAEPEDGPTDQNPALRNLNDKQLILRLWGEMPPEKRPSEGAGISPEFLPRYERLIREYYKRMSR